MARTPSLPELVREVEVVEAPRGQRELPPPDAASLNLVNGPPIEANFFRAVAILSGAFSTQASSGPDNAHAPTPNSPSPPSTTTAAPSGAASRACSSRRTTGLSSA